MTEVFKFRLVHQDKYSEARVGEITTPHGLVTTPVFMPVGTHASVKALPSETLALTKTTIILSNTYHLHLSPGSDLIAKAGGLHKFMNWSSPILTDSGGFQVFSLPQKKIEEKGVIFSYKGKQVLLSPEISMEVQRRLNADMIMAFDECIPWPADYTDVEKSIARTHRWLDRCVKAWDKSQALFGIIQGSTYKKLRRRCVDEVCARDLPGYAVGGVSVGEGSELMREIVGNTVPLLPKEKPRYVMGVGTPKDLLDIWEQGVDMSDCVIPTRYARGGTLFTRMGKIRISHRRYRRDFYPIDVSCSCFVCANYGRAYLHHLFLSNEIAGALLASAHNTAFYQELAFQAQKAVLEDRYLKFKKEYLSLYKSD